MNIACAPAQANSYTVGGSGASRVVRRRPLSGISARPIDGRILYGEVAGTGNIVRLLEKNEQSGGSVRPWISATAWAREAF